MKTLLLIRHAKSSWGDASISDFDRPLNERGKHDGPLMAQELSTRVSKLMFSFQAPQNVQKKPPDL